MAQRVAQRCLWKEHTFFDTDNEITRRRFKTDCGELYYVAHQECYTCGRPTNIKRLED